MAADTSPLTRTSAPTDTIRVAVSTVIFSLRSDESGRLAVVLPLVRRTRDPHEGLWALPGGWLDAAERLTAPLPASDRAAIFGGNAARIYLERRGRRPWPVPGT